MAEIPVSLVIWGGAWFLCLVVALVASLRDGGAGALGVAEDDSAQGVGEMPEAVEPQEPEPQPEPSDRFASGLAKSRGTFAGRLQGLLGGDQSDEDVFEGLEELLVASDVGMATAHPLVEAVRERVGPNRESAVLQAALREEIRELLGENAPVSEDFTTKPLVQLVVGVNGVGKTTTIGKLAARHVAAARKVLMIAGDTFRAAAGDQLAVWAERTGAEIVRQEPGADPSSVVFDGLEAARARGVDVVLVDTAGRLHTKVNLMEELKKLARVAGRVVPGAPHEVLLVLDATTGQNALAQAKSFSDAVEVSGIILSKLDGSARGGMALAVRKELGVPVRYVGLGEAVEDLQPFDPGNFLDGLMPEDSGPSG